MEAMDQALVEQAQRELPYVTVGFEALAERYYGYVRQIGRGIVGNTDDAETVAQDVMLRVFHHLPKLRDPVTFEGWLHRISTNAARSFLSREIREREKVELLQQEHFATAELPPAEVVPPNANQFDRLLSSLNLEERSILALRFVDDLGFPEIAGHLGLKLSATKMRYYRALDKLRIQLDTSLPA